MSHEYRWYEEFINRKGDYANIPKEKLFQPFLVRFCHWLICLILMVVLGLFFNYEHMLTETWANYTLPGRIAYLLMTNFYKVFTCFVGFVAMECNFIACGQSYSPAKKMPDGTEKPE